MRTKGNMLHSLWNQFYSSLSDSIVYYPYLQLHKISPEYISIDYVADLIEESQYIQDVSANASANIENCRIPRKKYEMMQSFYKYLTLRRIFEKAYELFGLTRAKEVFMALLVGKVYLHDSSAYLIPYCLGVDFSKLFEQGLQGTKLSSLPPKKPKSFINQVKETIIELSNEFAGAIAFPTLIISYAYIYLKYHGLNHFDEQEIVDDFQNLIHTINQEMRNGIESPFTNMSFFDKYILDEMVTYVYPHFVETLQISQEEFIKVVQKIQEIVIKFLAKGDPITGGPYPFPVLTANFILDEHKEIKDQEFLNLISQYNTRGIFNIYCSQDARKYSMCCRFQPDFKSLSFDSFGNGGINVGSIKVVTLNLHRIALQMVEIIKSTNYLDVNKLLYRILSTYFNYAKDILDVFRELLREAIAKKGLKYFNLGWFDLDKHFYSTVGFIGLWEMYSTLVRHSIISKDYVTFASEVLRFLDAKIQEANIGSRWKYNLEQVPGESAAAFLPKLDRLYFGEKLVPYRLYANQFIPLYENFSVFDKIRIEGQLFKYLSGGGISHINIAEELSFSVVANLIKSIAKAGIEHFALNPVFSICEQGHFSFGKVAQCSYCGCAIKDYVTRVVGFFTKVSSWVKERREWEFHRRLWYLNF